jgi:hypothetical protein
VGILLAERMQLRFDWAAPRIRTLLHLCYLGATYLLARQIA